MSVTRSPAKPLILGFEFEDRHRRRQMTVGVYGSLVFFDSGLGGLTVWVCRFRRTLPDVDFRYLADSAHVFFFSHTACAMRTTLQPDDSGTQRRLMRGADLVICIATNASLRPRCAYARRVGPVRGKRVLVFSLR